MEQNMKWRTNPGKSPEATLLSTNLSSGHLLLWPPLGAEITPRTRKTCLLKPRSASLWAESLSFSCALGYILGTWRCSRTLYPPEGRRK